MIVYISHGRVSFAGEKDELLNSYCVVKGGKVSEGKRALMIGLREHQTGYECLMRISDIGGLPPDAIVERATIDSVVVYFERSSKQCSI